MAVESPPRAPRGRRWPGAQAIGRGSAFALALFLSAPCLAADVALCESCHGPGGNSVTPLTPSIAGQPVVFLENQLVFFREGLRTAPVMMPVMKGVTDAEITALARHFSEQEARPAGAVPADPAAVARGRQIADARRCKRCHLANYEGHSQVPRLAGQRADWLLDSMKAFRDGKRAGGDTMMTDVLDGLSDTDLAALTAYLASLPPAPATAR
jgi:cytochrome c553